MRLDNYVRLCYINLFDYELRCAVSGRSIRLVGGYPMNRFFFLILFVVSLLFSGCISRGYIHGRTPTDGYNEGYALGASMLPSKKLPTQPNAMVALVWPQVADYWRQASSVPGWYTCNDWVYNPDGEAIYYAYQSVYTDYNTRELRLTQAPPRPQTSDTDGYGRKIHPNGCYHVKFLPYSR